MKKLFTFLLLTFLCLANTKIFSQNEVRQKANDLADQTVVYPVPAKSTEQVSVAFPEQLNLQSVQLVKIDGWVPGGWVQSPQNQKQINLQLPKLSSGTYVLKFSLLDGQVFSKKIIVSR